jgi:PAS domain S-box-containing protein
MLKKLRTITELYLLVALMVVFTFALGICGVKSIKTVKDEIQTLYLDRLIPLGDLSEIRYMLQKNIVTVIEELKDGEISLDETLRKIGDAEKNIYKKWKPYTRTYLTEKEKLLVAETESLMLELNHLIAIKATAVTDKQTNVLTQQHVEDLYAVVNRLIYNTTALINFQIDVSQEVMKEGEEEHQATLFKFILIVLFCLLVAIPFTYHLVKNVKKLIVNLKNSNQQIKLSEERYRYLFENNPAYVIIWDLESMTVRDVNQAVVEKYGYTKEEWIGMSVLQYRPEEDHEKIVEFSKKMLEGAEPIARMVWRHLKKNGEEMYMEIASHKMLYNNKYAILSLARDITEQRNAELALRKSEEKFKSLVDHAADGIFMVEDNGTIFDVNIAGAELLLYSREELIGKSVLDLHPHQEKPKVPQLWDTLRKARTLVDERELLRKDGTIVDVEISRKMLPDSTGAISIVRDITERKKAEALLFESLKEAADFKYALDESTIAAITDHRGIIKKVNQNFCKISKYSEEELIGQDHRIINSGYHSKEFMANLWSTIAKGKVWRGELRNKAKDGTIYWVDTTIVPFLTEKGIPFQYVAVRSDITERKKAEEQANIEKLLSDSIINSLPGIFYLRDKQGKIIRWNKNAESILSYNQQQAQHLHTFDFVDENQIEKVKESYNKMNETGNSEAIVYLTNRENKKIPYFFTGRKLKFDVEEYVVAIGLDISERIDAEIKLKERSEEIQKLSSHLDNIQEAERMRISREVHDELGQQLTGIKMDAFWIAKNVTDSEGKVNKKVADMIALIDQTIKIVRRIATDLRPGILDDLGLIAAIEWQGQEFEKRTGTKVVLNTSVCDFNLDKNLSTNMFRVYQEILTNIMRHAEATLVETNFKVDDDTIILQVKDNGKGFDLEEVKDKGSLGLLGMKERVLLLNGQLFIESEKTKGTSITVKIPIINN